MDKGYIKLYRSLFDNAVVCKDADYVSVWVYLLCEATHIDFPVMFAGEKIVLKPGQFTTGRKRISEKLKISESKVQRILKAFEIEQQIEQRTDRQCRLITILNWEQYQSDEQRNEQRVNNDRTTSEQRVNTKQTHKHINTKTQNNIYSDLPPELAQAVKDFVEHRKTLKRPMTDYAVELMLKKANRLSGGDTAKSIELIKTAIESGWLTVYEKTEYKKPKMKNFMDIEV